MCSAVRPLVAFFMAVLIFPLVSHAKDFPDCNRHYYLVGHSVSTEICYDENGRWGKATAYDRTGKVIYERELRRVAGHSSVEFYYYKSGAVKKAYASSAPDGGIQWYRSTTFFSEDGVITNETKESHEGITSLPRQVTLPIVERKKQQEVATCAVIYVSEIWATNTTPYPMQLTVNRKYTGAESHVLKVAPGETVKAGELIAAEHFDDPAIYYDMKAVPLAKHSKLRPVIVPSPHPSDSVGKERRKYYFEIRRII